ncbi:MAG: DinB family protein [Planctomycetota bacterium]
MNSILKQALRYSAWATKALISAARSLSEEQLNAPAPGYGSVLSTLRHVIRSDAGYLGMLNGDRPAWAKVEIETGDLDQLEAYVDETHALWEQLLAEPIDASRKLVLDDGAYECSASVVWTQAIHHANAHREQVRAALRGFDVEPPDVQPWEYALDAGCARWLREPS